MPSTVSLSIKLIRIGASLLVIALASIGLTLWVTWQLEGGAAAVNEAGRMRMQTWRLNSAVAAQLPASEVQALVSQFDQSLGLLRSGDPSRPLFVPWDDEVGQQFVIVEALWQNQRPLWLGEQPPDTARSLQAAGEFVDAIDRFVLVIEKQLSGYTAILNLFQFVMMALAIGGAVIMLYTGYLYVINPLAHLRRVLAQVEAGEFGTRIDVDTQDEFGQVAAGFNRMASTLQSLYEGLEAKVQAKTQRIEAQRARLEALYEVSAFLAQANTIEELSRGFSQRVRQVMKADAVAVRWSDEANQRYLMLASDCFPQDMQEEERSLLAGACACGNLKPDARTRVIPIHTHDAAPMRHCARAGYESLVSVPVRLQQRLIGEIDLFFRSDVQINADETELLDALASHLASALEGLRAAALEREAAVGEERALLARELHDSIAQSLAFLKIQAGLLRSAVQKQQPEKVNTTLDELDAGLKESINDVRELLVHFRTRTNTDDIEAALQETLQKFQHQTGLPTRLQLEGEGLPLPPDVQVQVLHVLQESLSNVRKHAGASHVSLDVHKGARWRFVVRDNGSGFDTGQQRSENHVGMKIMRERAERIGASVELVSSPGQGTTVTLTLPPYPVSAPGIGTLGLNLQELSETLPAP
ncbi:MAG: type IV pili methyl-accepting chemotaxis transducer N-terminal domain-containing protein [Hydrogenophaga sp.]|jgi:two-component system nitrate/nitrite sensor histidine kinase NarX|uniref:type IV pili methyl-accepting chemotaxis transducer N-terminal domain-containing protein n=1 Tax=Hydrogenophaga sp. TaxID=1904254 RepID=UPI00272FCFEE|nr:type IV pili methyl-accepting chemotaxis transducer N-terminal domain-containing protein [Hydrogenophaga sp.]MDP2408439.1 type IV pili methyl-accepting chemotaxis transducer N-terminal domain-containing protein [Hydrogenophaga sp.]MDZ4173477.1 type IV pili methyl-accepting chemotaxis transducer N-terminal domain-containing protein [Hydrogenophaga sp.]